MIVSTSTILQLLPDKLTLQVSACTTQGEGGCHLSYKDVCV